MQALLSRCGCAVGTVVMLMSLVSMVQAEVGDQISILTPDGDDGGFGNAVGIDEDIVVAGAHYSDNPSYNSGAAYLFDATTGNQMNKLSPNFPRESAYFGRQAAISKNNVIVGAPWRDYTVMGEGGLEVKRNIGAAYIFDASSGGQSRVLGPDDPREEYQYFGRSVGISGNIAIVGSDESAYLFDVSKGTRIGKYLGASPDQSPTDFGSAVAIDRNIAIVGAYSDNSSSGSAFLIDTKSGDVLHRLNPTGGGSYGMFGYSVAICGNIAVVGAPFENSDTGSVYVFNATSGQQLAKLNGTSSSGCFGSSVAVSGNVVVVGAEGANRDSGAAYLFNATKGQIISELYPSDGTDLFGAGVAIDGKKAVVAAQWSNASEGGAVYMFEAPDPTTLDMPKMPVEYYRQTEAGWGEDLYGRSTTKKMKGKGCALTCLSMGLDYAGVTDQDPGTLNSLMKVTGGFTSDSNVVWGTAVRAAANQAGLPNVQFHAACSSDTAVLDELLATGNPVIVRVVNGYTPEDLPKYHYVLVTGKELGENGNPDVYSICDPGYAGRTTLASYNNSFETRGYICDPADVSELDISVSSALSGLGAGSGINIRVTDPWGNVTYYDGTGAIVKNIPDSVLFVDSIADLLTDEVDSLSQMVLISKPGLGDYQVLVSCLDGVLTPYSLTISAFGKGGSLQWSHEYSGSLGAGGTQLYSFSYVPEPSALVLVCMMAMAIGMKKVIGDLIAKR